MRRKALHAPECPLKYNEKIVNKSTDARIFKDAVLLTNGSWVDSITGEKVKYSKSAIKKSAGNWIENILNIDHDTEVLKRLGYVNNPYYKDGKLLGDLHIYPITQNSRDVINLIDEGLVNWLSVEVITEDEYNHKLGMIEVKSMEFLGCAVITNPACDETKIK